jgi:hypothetical protein
MMAYLLRFALSAVLVLVLNSGPTGALQKVSKLSGTWEFSVDLETGGHGDPTFVFKQEGDKLTGTYDGPMGQHEVTGTVTGNKAVFGFQATDEGETVKATYTAMIDGDTKMSGTVEFSSGVKGKWTAKKK